MWNPCFYLQIFETSKPQLSHKKKFFYPAQAAQQVWTKGTYIKQVDGNEINGVDRSNTLSLYSYITP